MYDLYGLTLYACIYLSLSLSVVAFFTQLEEIEEEGTDAEMRETEAGKQRGKAMIEEEEEEDLQRKKTEDEQTKRRQEAEEQERQRHQEATRQRQLQKQKAREQEATAAAKEEEARRQEQLQRARREEDYLETGGGPDDMDLGMETRAQRRSRVTKLKKRKTRYACHIYICSKHLFYVALILCFQTIKLLICTQFYY